MPVGRENCSSTSSDAAPLPTQSEAVHPALLMTRDAQTITGSEEYMDVNWRITFSGLKPHRHSWNSILGHLADTSNTMPGNWTDYEMHQQHDRVELLSAYFRVNF